MVRKLRVEYAGAIHSVMNRGRRRDRVSVDDAETGSETVTGSGGPDVRSVALSRGKTRRGVGADGLARVDRAARRSGSTRGCQGALR